MCKANCKKHQRAFPEIRGVSNVVFIKETFAFLLQSFSIGNQCCLTFYPAPCISTSEGKNIGQSKPIYRDATIQGFCFLFVIQRLKNRLCKVQNIVSKARVCF